MKFTDLQARLAGMTRKQANQLADSAGVPRTTIAHIRKGRTASPRVGTVEKLTAALGKPRARRAAVEA